MIERRLIARRSFLLGGAAAALAACSGSGSDARRSSPSSDRTRTTGTTETQTGGATTTAGAGGKGQNPIVVHWGKDRAQVCDLWLPSVAGAKPIGVVALLHGGYWRPGFDRTLMNRLARDIVSRGWAAWNMEYRVLGEGGGWPATYLDVAHGLDELAQQADSHHLDLDRVAVLGHSAGGTLALWTAARAKLPPKAPGSKPRVLPGLVVSQAGVNNLIAGVFENLGQGSVVALMGAEPEQAMQEYLWASPVEQLPLGVPQVIEYGALDTVVPIGQSTKYAAKAELAKDEVTLIEAPKGDHLSLIDPKGPEWPKVAAQLAKLLDG